MDIARLRLETTADHRAAEESLPLMNESLCREEYIAFLVGIYGIVSAWEACAASNAPLWLQSIVIARQRKQMLEADLTYFNVPLNLSFDASCPDHKQLVLPPIRSEAGLLGSMYVMEGSTLGGQLIARHVERVLNLGKGHGDAYFRGHGDSTGAMWKEFCGILLTRVPDTEANTTIHSAKAMFRVFGAWMRQVKYAPKLQECIPR